MTYVKNQFGFNLVELLVAVAVLALVALGGATLAQVATNASSYNDRKNEANALASFVMEHLKNERTCKEALAGTSLAGPNKNGRGNLNGNAARTINGPKGRQIAIEIRGLSAGKNMDSDIWDPDFSLEDKVILPRRLRVKDISLRDGVSLTSTASSRSYLANVYMEVEEIGGMSYKPMMIGSLTIDTDMSYNMTNCQSMPSDALAKVCADDAGMGCEWDPDSQPNCRCKVAQEVCMTPGWYPIAFRKDPNHPDRNAVPDCRPLGGGLCSNPDEYLVGVGIDRLHCAPIPTSCPDESLPNGSSLTGLGNPVAGLPNCKCKIAGETYVTGQGCVGNPTPTPTPGPSCTLVSGQTLYEENVPQDCQQYCDNFGWCKDGQKEWCCESIQPLGANQCRIIGMKCNPTPTPTPTQTPTNKCTGPAIGYWSDIMGPSGGPLGMQGCSSVGATLGGPCSCPGELCSVNNNTSPPNLTCVTSSPQPKCLCWDKTGFAGTTILIESTTGNCSSYDGTMSAGKCYATTTPQKVVACNDPSATVITNGCSSAPYCKDRCLPAASGQSVTRFDGYAYNSESACLTAIGGTNGALVTGALGNQYYAYCEPCPDFPGAWQAGSRASSATTDPVCYP